MEGRFLIAFLSDKLAVLIKRIPGAYVLNMEGRFVIALISEEKKASLIFCLRQNNYTDRTDFPRIYYIFHSLSCLFPPSRRNWCRRHQITPEVNGFQLRVTSLSSTRRILLVHHCWQVCPPSEEYCLSIPGDKFVVCQDKIFFFRFGLHVAYSLDVYVAFSLQMTQWSSDRTPI